MPCWSRALSSPARSIFPIVRGELSALRTDLPHDLTELEQLVDRYAPGSSDFVSTSDLTGLVTGQAGTAAFG